MTIIKGLVKLLPKGQWSRSAAHHKFSQEFKSHFADFDSLQSFMYADKFCLLTLIVLPWTAKKTGLVDHQRSQVQQKVAQDIFLLIGWLTKIIFIYQMTDIKISIHRMTDLDVATQVGPSDDEDRLPAKLQAPVEARRGSRWILRARCHSFVEEYSGG